MSICKVGLDLGGGWMGLWVAELEMDEFVLRRLGNHWLRRYDSYEVKMFTHCGESKRWLEGMYL